MKIQNYLKFSEQLRESTTYEESFEAYTNYVLSLGLKSISYVFLPDSPFNDLKSAPPRFSVSENFSQSFLQEYEARQFQESDYIVNEINNGKSNKIYHWEEDQKSGLMTPSEKNMLEIAGVDYQMSNGCSIVTAKSAHGIGATSVVGDDKDALFSLYLKEHKDTLAMATDTFHNHIVTKSYEVIPFIMCTVFSELNAIEKKILKCILDGCSVPETAARVHKSKRYIEKLIRVIRIKVGGELPCGKPKISKDKLIHFCGLMRIYNEL